MQVPVPRSKQTSSDVVELPPVTPLVVAVMVNQRTKTENFSIMDATTSPTAFSILPIIG
jgi:hypothetical protein